MWQDGRSGQEDEGWNILPVDIGVEAVRLDGGNQQGERVPGGIVDEHVHVPRTGDVHLDDDEVLHRGLGEAVYVALQLAVVVTQTEGGELRALDEVGVDRDAAQYPGALDVDQLLARAAHGRVFLLFLVVGEDRNVAPKHDPGRPSRHDRGGA